MTTLGSIAPASSSAPLQPVSAKNGGQGAECFHADTANSADTRRARHLPKPPALELFATPTKSPPKRTVDEIDGAHLEDCTQAGASHNRDYFGDESGVDICLCQPSLSAQKIPRPRNAFILYRQYTSPQIMRDTPGLGVPEVSKVVGQKWNSLSEKEQARWRDAAEEEKQRHQQEHPNYRYQPNRTGRRNSVAETPVIFSSQRCIKCGKKPMVNPTTPSSGEPQRTSLTYPPSTPQSAFFNHSGRQLPPMVGPPLASPHRRSGSKNHPANIHIPPISQLTNFHGADKDPPTTPEAKRRRFTSGNLTSMTTQQPQQSQYTVASPYRGSFNQSHPPQHWAAQSRQIMPPPQQQMTSGLGQPPRQVFNEMLTLPKDQQGGKTLEEIFKGGSVTEQLKVLGRVSQPLQNPKPSEASYAVRGAAVAVEGDDPRAIQSVVHFLEADLGKCEDFSVQVAEGPEAPDAEKEVDFLDFIDMASIWCRKGDEIIQYMTTLPRSDGEQSNDGIQRPQQVAPSLPVLLLNRYSHFATTTWASRIPTKGLYEAKDHWLWFATLWRIAIGPDLTVYVRDASADEMARCEPVEVVKDLRVIFVRRGRGEGQDAWKVDGATLRRLWFEVKEWILALAGRDCA